MVWDWTQLILTVLYQWLFAGRHWRAHAHTLQDKNVFFKGLLQVLGWGGGIQLMHLWGWPGPNRLAMMLLMTCTQHYDTSLMKYTRYTTLSPRALPEVRCRPIRSFSWSFYTHMHSWPHTPKAIKYNCNILCCYSLLLKAPLSLS